MPMTPAMFKISDGTKAVGIGETTLRDWAKHGYITLHKPDGMRLTLVETAEVIQAVKKLSSVGLAVGPESSQKA